MSEDTMQGEAAIDGGTHDKEEKTTTIIINATPHEVAGKEISYAQVINMAYNNAPPTGENFSFTVTFSRGDHGQEGTMLPGDRVKLKSKMVFDVSATDRS
jgi:hypothetical protein